MSEWWTGIPPAQTTIQCRGESHRLRWADGELTALDHDDLKAERTLAALGGEPCTCAEIAEGWQRHRHDLLVLVLASRGPGDPLSPADEPATAITAVGYGHSSSAVGWTSYAPLPLAAASEDDDEELSGAEVEEEFGDEDDFAEEHEFDEEGESDEEGELLGDDHELARLLRLGGGLPDRLVATVAAHWTARPSHSLSEAARLTAAVTGRATAALRGWLGDPALAVDVHLINPGDAPELSRRDRRLVAELPTNWLGSVAGRGLAVVWSRFVLDAQLTSEGALELTAVDAALGQPETIVLSTKGLR